MSEIDYGVLIDRLIQDFRPVKRLWPVHVRLLLWILLEAAILAVAALLNGRPDLAVIYFHNYDFGAAGFFLVSIAAAWMALRNSIPGRETGAAELILLAFGIIAAALIVQFEPLAQAPLSSNDFRSVLGRQLAFAGLPWVTLFWAVRRAMPLRPRLAGGLIGVAVACFAIATVRFSGLAYPVSWELLSGAILTVLAVIAGAAWLGREALWRKASGAARDLPVESAWAAARVIFPFATALAAGLLLLVLRVGTGGNQPVPDFDLAIENYQQALTNFRPNVPSNSIEKVLAAYIERGMPSYMWDFGPQGFKLVGGRFEHLPDGTPVTFTWFRGTKAGVMCMLRRVSGFQAPRATHIERDHLLFYRYRGYSVCLINVGGYGDFVSVIVSPMPMKQFIRMVRATLSIERR